MKKSKIATLVLITASLASCNKQKKVEDWDNGNQVYMRSDTTADYQYTGCSGANSYWLWHYAFRPYGMYYGGNYQHYGYYSSAISERANIGASVGKTSVVRGGFGSSHGFSVSS